MCLSIKCMKTVKKKMFSEPGLVNRPKPWRDSVFYHFQWYNREEQQPEDAGLNSKADWFSSSGNVWKPMPGKKKTCRNVKHNSFVSRKAHRCSAKGCKAALCSFQSVIGGIIVLERKAKVFLHLSFFCFFASVLNDRFPRVINQSSYVTSVLNNMSWRRAATWFQWTCGYQ